MSIITIVAPILVSSGILAAVCKWLATSINKSIKASKEHEKALEDGMKSLLRDRILQLARECIRKGYATLEERENFEAMYESYKSLGGNGVIEDVAEQFHELPIMKQGSQK